MAKTTLGEFKVTEINRKKRENDTVLVTIKCEDEFKNKLDNFIEDLGKFEAFINGASVFLDAIGMISINKNYEIIHLDFERVKKFQKSEELDTYTLRITAKTDEITNQGKLLYPNKVDEMIENIDRYHSLKETLKLFRNEMIV